MIDDAHIRQLMIKAIPEINPALLEVAALNYDATVGYWYRGEMGTLHGAAIALNRPAETIAADLATDLASLIVGDRLGISPYEGKAGRHPDDCTCSRHAKAVNGQAQ